MKKFSSLLFIIVMSVFMTVSVSGAVIDSGQNTFYVTNKENVIYWGGGFEVSSKLSDNEYLLFIAFYDEDRLIAIDSVMVDENLDSFEFSEQMIMSSKTPTDLTAKAFAWSADGNMSPLSKMVEAENMGTFQGVAGNISTDEFTLNVLENNVELLKLNSYVYTKQTVRVETTGKNVYTMNVLKELEYTDGSTEQISEQMKIDSRMTEFCIEEIVDHSTVEKIKMTVSFNYNGGKSWETVKEFVVSDLFDGYEYIDTAYLIEADYEEKGILHIYNNSTKKIMKYAVKDEVTVDDKLMTAEEAVEYLKGKSEFFTDAAYNISVPSNANQLIKIRIINNVINRIFTIDLSLQGISDDKWNMVMYQMTPMKYTYSLNYFTCNDDTSIKFNINDDTEFIYIPSDRTATRKYSTRKKSMFSVGGIYRVEPVNVDSSQIAKIVLIYE